jgi:hypothetical protein
VSPAIQEGRGAPSATGMEVGVLLLRLWLKVLRK